MGIVVLVGSGEFTAAMVDTDKYLLSLLPSPAKVAILPTAAGQEVDYVKWIKRGLKHFNRLGAKPLGIRLIERKHTAEPKLLKQLQEADFIYFSGGNPGYLADVILASPVEKIIRAKLKQKNFILAGASAGAMFFSEFLPKNIFAMNGTKQLPNWVKGLAIVPYSVVPHYDYLAKKEPELLSRWLTNLPHDVKKNLIGIDEDTAFVVGNQKIMGRGRVISLSDVAV